MKAQLSKQQERALRRVLSESTVGSPMPPARLPETLLAAVTRTDKHGLPEPRRTLALIGAQAPVALRGRLLPGLAVFVALVFLAAAVASNGYDLLVLTASLPAATALFISLLSGRHVDPAHELVASTKTSFGAVVFARTTIVLAFTIAFGLAASVALAASGGRSLASLVTSWLGPTLLVSALATLLAQRWSLAATVISTLSLWGAVSGWIYLELGRLVPFQFGTSALLRPDPLALATQLLLVVVLLVSTWWLANVNSGYKAAA